MSLKKEKPRNTLLFKRTEFTQKRKEGPVKLGREARRDADGSVKVCPEMLVRD